MPRPAATRNVILAVVASGVLGGSIGALATAAASSSASPAAIAAAVQRVKDSTADSALGAISAELKTIEKGVSGEEGPSGEPVTLFHEVQTICSEVHTGPAYGPGEGCYP